MKPYIKHLHTTCFALILGGALGLQTSPADEVVTSWTGGASHLYLGMTNLTFGYEFTVGSQEISVTALGLWVPVAPSPTAGLLNYSHEVGLWDITGSSLLAYTTIGSGTPPSLSPSGAWYESVGPLTLSANTTYVLGAKYPEFAMDIDWGTRGAVATSGAGVTLGDARYSYMAFAFPSAVDANLNDGYYGPNMLYTVVPEPATCTLLGLGMLALVWFRRNRR
jgi:hypothetical protein